MSEQDLRDEIKALRDRVKAQEEELIELRGRLWHLEHPASPDEADPASAQDSPEAA